MKYLHVISSINPVGGGPIEGVRLLSTEMSRAGHEANVVCLDSPDAHFIVDFPARVHAIGPVTSTYAYNRKLVPWLRAHAREYDVVIVNGLWQYCGFAVWRALAGTNTPYVVFTHGMLDPWFKKTYPLKHLKKWLYWPWAEYRVLRDAKNVIFTCEEERLLARESFWLYRCNEAVTSYGTAPPPKNTPVLTENFFNFYPQLRDKRIVLFLGRIHEKKGCDLLVEAFARVANKHDDLHLLMAGPDQAGWGAELKALADKYDVADKITWPGMLAGDLKWGAFYACEVFSLPSHQENFGIAVAEALACAKPVLISNKVNIWREIEADNAGFVADDTVEGTVTTLEKWLALTPLQQKQMQEAAQTCFATRFHIQKVAKSFESILMARDVVAERSTGELSDL